MSDKKPHNREKNRVRNIATDQRRKDAIAARHRANFTKGYRARQLERNAAYRKRKAA